MPKTPQVRGISADCLGVEYDEESDTVDITFVVEGGDHLHVVLTQGGFETLSRHIGRVSEKIPGPSARG